MRVKIWPVCLIFMSSSVFELKEYLPTLSKIFIKMKSTQCIRTFVQRVTQLTFLTREFISFLFTHRADSAESKDGLSGMCEISPSRMRELDRNMLVKLQNTMHSVLVKQTSFDP